MRSFLSLRIHFTSFTSWCSPPKSHKFCAHFMVCRLLFLSSSSSAFETAKRSGYILKAFTSLSWSVRSLFSSTFLWWCVICSQAIHTFSRATASLCRAETGMCRQFSAYATQRRWLLGLGLLGIAKKEAAIVLYVIMPCWVNACQTSLTMILLHYANCIFEAL